MRRVYVVLVNWKGWRDTLMCLESLLRSDYPDFRVVLCDNDSGDGSVERIVEWATGSLAADTPPAGLDYLTTPALPKPIACRVYDRATAEAGGQPDDPQLLVIQTGGNLGFAGGNNVGMRYAMARKDAEFIWLLNTDTVVPPNSLKQLLLRSEQDKLIGICGSTLLFMEQPQTVQALGGSTYFCHKGTARPIGLLSNWPQTPDVKSVEAQTDYVVGASMFVRRAFIEEVGLMQEDYFLYFEELDWACRGKGQYRLAYAPDSIVYHRVGGSTESVTSLAYFQFNRLKFARRFFPLFLPLVYIFMAVDAVKALVKGKTIKMQILRSVMVGRSLSGILRKYRKA